MTSRGLVSILALSLLALPARTLAATIRVPPGAGTLQAAIDAASDGDTLVGAGLYTGPVVVTKSIKIVAAKSAAIQIDAECAAPVGLTIAADGVKIKGPVYVTGATTTAVFVDDTSHTRMQVISAEETCGTATTGIDIHESDHLVLKGGNVFDFLDRALRLEGSGPKARISISGMHGLGSTVGFALDDIADGVERKAAGVLIKQNIFNGGVQAGFALTEADGVVLKLNNVSEPATAVTIDALSANNVFQKNEMGGAVVDAGSGTCWKGNSGYPDSCL